MKKKTLLLKSKYSRTNSLNHKNNHSTHILAIILYYIMSKVLKIIKDLYCGSRLLFFL